LQAKVPQEVGVGVQVPAMHSLSVLVLFAQVVFPHETPSFTAQEPLPLQSFCVQFAGTALQTMFGSVPMAAFTQVPLEFICAQVRQPLQVVLLSLQQTRFVQKSPGVHWSSFPVQGWP
jgi:hypothetical protein